MAYALLAELSFGERIALPFFESLAHQDLSANEILRRYMGARESVLARIQREQPELLTTYQKHFGRIRRQKGLGLVRFLKLQVAKRPYALNLTRAAMPTEARVAYGRNGMSHAYAYKFRAVGTDRFGVRGERWVTVTSDKLVPWGTLEGTATNYFASTESSGGMIAYSMTHQEILQRPREGAPV